MAAQLTTKRSAVPTKMSSLGFAADQFLRGIHHLRAFLITLASHAGACTDRLSVWSGNIFLYRLDGKFTIEDFTKLNYVYGSGSLKPGYLPIKYTLLNLNIIKTSFKLF